MPRAADSPKVMSTLVRRQAIEISHTRFRVDVDHLIKSVERILASEKEKDLKRAGAGLAKQTAQSEQWAFETPRKPQASLTPDPNLIVMDPHSREIAMQNTRFV